MSQAWPITGPPGSGRSNAAKAFAAALQCAEHGCGQCNACRTTLSGAHPDVTLVRTEALSIGVDEVRELVRRAAMNPAHGRHQVVVVEDADRITERGADALLKAIEEPAPKTVWLLCAPTPEDVIVTIRSRCRRLHLATPRDEAVADLLTRRDGIPPEMAAEAARAGQGHIGRARRLARDEEARARRNATGALRLAPDAGSRPRRNAIGELPTRLRSLGDCLQAAEDLVNQASEEDAAATAESDASERAELEKALGFGSAGARPRNAQAAIRDLEKQQAARSKRLQRDALDRVLTELTAYHRDVLAIQTGAVRPEEENALRGARLVNAGWSASLHRVAHSQSPEHTVATIDATPLLVMETLLIAMTGAARSLANPTCQGLTK